MLALTACSPSPSGGTFTVDYYRAHATERAATVRACANDPGNLRDSPDCVNAQRAARMEDVGSLKSLPPMGLPGSPKRDQLPNRDAPKD